MAPSRGGAGAALLALLAAVLVCLLQTTTTVQAATTLQTTGDTFEAAFEVSWTPRREGPRGRHWPHWWRWSGQPLREFFFPQTRATQTPQARMPRR